MHWRRRFLGLLLQLPNGMCAYYIRKYLSHTQWTMMWSMRGQGFVHVCYMQQSCGCDSFTHITFTSPATRFDGTRDKHTHTFHIQNRRMRPTFPFRLQYRLYYSDSFLRPYPPSIRPAAHDARASDRQRRCEMNNMYSFMMRARSPSATKYCTLYAIETVRLTIEWEKNYSI